MKSLGVSLPQPVVPNVVGRVITVDLLRHLQRRLLSDQGLFVVDLSGTLIRQILPLIPSRRVSDVCWFDPLADRRCSYGSNFLNVYPDDDPFVVANDANTTLQQIHGAEYSQEEGALLSTLLRTAHQKIGQAGVSRTDFLSPWYFAALLLDAETRDDWIQGLWNDELTQYWQDAYDPVVGRRLVTRFQFLFEDPRLIWGMNSTIGEFDYHHFDPAWVVRQGKILLLSLPAYDLSPQLRCYFTSTLMNRMVRAAPANFPIDDVWYLSSTTRYQTPSRPLGQHARLMTKLVRTYSQLKWTEPNSWLQDQQSELLGQFGIQLLDPWYNTRSLFATSDAALPNHPQ